MDAASYLADRRWWGSKQDLVERATAVGQDGSALLSLNHSVHHTFSDVLVLGEKALAAIAKLRRNRPSSVRRGGVADEDMDAGKAGEEEEAVVPTAEALLNESTGVMLDFFASHVASSDGPERGTPPGWAAKLCERQRGGGGGASGWTRSPPLPACELDWHK